MRHGLLPKKLAIKLSWGLKLGNRETEQGTKSEIRTMKEKVGDG